MSEEQRAQVEEPTAEMREIFGVSFSAAEHFAQMLAEEGELRGLVTQLKGRLGAEPAVIALFGAVMSGARVRRPPAEPEKEVEAV